MSSFFAESIVFIAHQKATVSAFLSSSRPLFNSSIIPVVLNMDETWRLLGEGDKVVTFEQNLLGVFRYSNTLQFAPSLKVSSDLPNTFMSDVFNCLLEQPYFCRTLKRLSVTCGYTALHEILAKVRSLESFEFLIRTSVTDAYLPSFSQASNLRSLKLINARQITRDSFVLMCERLPRLEKLVVHSATSLKDDDWIAALSKLPLLEVLDIDVVTGASDIFMKSLFPQKLKNLREFDVRKSMPVFSLSVTRRVDMTDEGVAALTGLNNLQKLDLSASHITDKSLKVLAGSHPSLTHLVLDECTRIIGSSSGLEFLASLPALKSLSLERLNGILNDEWLQVIGTFSGLEVLKLGENEGVTDKGLELLCCRCGSRVAEENGSSLSPIASSLREIVLPDCLAITSKGLTALSKLPCLEIFVCRNFSSLDDEGVRCFPNFPSLQHLAISGSWQVTAGAVWEALPRCKKLRKIFLENFVNLNSADYQILEKALLPILYVKADTLFNRISSSS